MYIGENIRYLRNQYGYSQEDLAKALGYKSYTTITKWESGVSEPTLKMTNQIADFFKISVNELCYTRLGMPSSDPQEQYYLNDEAREMAQFMYENPEYKVLFDASRKVSKADIETVKMIMDKFRSDDN